MRLLALLTILLALPLAARADCVWIPTCIVQDIPPANYLVVKLDNVEVRRISPVYSGRGHFWQCGRSTSLLSLSLLRGREEFPLFNIDDTDPEAPFDPDTCTGGVITTRPASLGSFYGPKEQLLRAIRQLQNGGGPIDTNQDGRITPTDQTILERTALGTLRDYTDFICAEDVCP